MYSNASKIRSAMARICVRISDDVGGGSEGVKINLCASVWRRSKKKCEEYLIEDLPSGDQVRRCFMILYDRIAPRTRVYHV